MATVKVTSGVEGAASYLTEAGLAGGGQAQGSKTSSSIDRNTTSLEIVVVAVGDGGDRTRKSGIIYS